MLTSLQERIAIHLGNTAVCISFMAIHPKVVNTCHQRHWNTSRGNCERPRAILYRSVWWMMEYFNGICENFILLVALYIKPGITKFNKIYPLRISVKPSCRCRDMSFKVQDGQTRQTDRGRDRQVDRRCSPQSR